MPYQKELEPRIKEVSLPQQGGMWGALNRYEQYSKYTIPDTDFDDLNNAIPMGQSVRQIPANTLPFASVPAPIVWMIEFPLNAGFFLFCLCTDGHLYQVSIPGGIRTDCSTSTPLSIRTSIALWQETQVIVSDPDVSKTYSWDGATFTTLTDLNAIKGATITVFSGRLWLASGNVVVFTQGGTYNSVAGDSGSFKIVDSDCLTQIQALYPFNGLLYIFGQDWAQVIGNLYVSGSPAQLQFQKYTIESGVGLSTFWSIITFGSTLYLANPNGIWSLTGTIPIKISNPVDAVFDGQLADSTLSSCFAEIYSEPCMLWALHSSIDNSYGALAYSIVLQKWFRITTSTIKFLADGTINNTSNTWGTDGTNIYSMFNNFVDSVTSTFGFKYWNFGTPISFKRVMKMGIASLITTVATATLNAYNENGIQLKPPFGQQTQSVISTLTFIGKDGNPINWTN